MVDRSSLEDDENSSNSTISTLTANSIGITDLPNECLALIVSFLPWSTTECLAKTFNRHVYDFCLPYLQRRINLIRNCRRMTRLFYPRDTSSDYEHLLQDYLGYHRGHLWFEEPSWDDNLVGDFAWSTGLTIEAGHHERKNLITDEHVDTFLRQTRQLGISIPPAFLNYVHDSQLREHLISHIPSWWRASSILGGLKKVNMKRLLRDDGREVPFSDEEHESYGQGYICPIEEDWSDDEHVGLYLDTKGGHCVFKMHLFSRTKKDADDFEKCDTGPEVELTDLEKELGIVPMHNLWRRYARIRGKDFETWLRNLNHVERAVAAGR